MSILYKVFNTMNSSILGGIQRFLPIKYIDLAETVRMEKWITEGHYRTFKSEEKKLCSIEEGLFDYPLFQVSFLKI